MNVVKRNIKRINSKQEKKQERINDMKYEYMLNERKDEKKQTKCIKRQFVQHLSLYLRSI
jgi:hypothetical protein